MVAASTFRPPRRSSIMVAISTVRLLLVRCEVERLLNINFPHRQSHWQKVSFSSTLCLYPILDLLLNSVPKPLHNEVRLGLQEALVNAATHGNALNPGKCITVEYRQSPQGYCWIITDQGMGFDRPCPCPQVVLDCPNCVSPWFPPDESENGRGLGILMQVFDQVHWNEDGTRLRLSKKIKRRPQVDSQNVVKRFFSESYRLLSL